MIDLYGGRVKIETIDRATGEVVDQYGPDNNMIVDEGVGYFWRRLASRDSGHGLAFNSIAVGVDYGDADDWDEFNPAPPHRKLVAEDQDAIYFTPFSNMTFDYPVDNVIKITGLIDGVEAMTQSFPTEYSAVFTSATLRFGNGRVFAYKRFPARYISRDVDIRIVWTLTMQNASTFCGFKEPIDDGFTFIYFGSQTEVTKLNMNGEKQFSFVHHTQDITSIAADLAGFVYTGSEDGAINKQDSNRNEIWINNGNAGAVISSVSYDDMGNVYTAASNGDVKKLTEYADQLWAITEDSSFIALAGIDKDHNVYYYDLQSGVIKKLSPMGSELWVEEEEHSGLGIIQASTSKTGNTFTIASDETLRMFNFDGEFLWDVPLDGTPSCVKSDPNDYIVVGFSDTRLDKYDLAGDLVWTVDVPTDWVTHMDIDNDGTIFIATRDQKVHRITKDGVLDWTYDDILAPINALTVNRN